MSDATSETSVDLSAPAFAAHEGGKLEVRATKPLRDKDDLSLLYTPGVADVCLGIAADPQLSHVYTARKNTVAVVSDGSAVLGLGDIGPRASLPVMEGKSALFKNFAGLDSIPLVLSTKDPDEIVETRSTDAAKSPRSTVSSLSFPEGMTR